MELFSIADVMEIEQSVLNSSAIEEVDWYFNEAVAQVLYKAWVENNSDNRIVSYSFPLILAMSKKNTALFENIGMDYPEIFSILTVGLIKALNKYDTSRGRLFSYLTRILTFRIYDINQYYLKNKKVEMYELLENDMPYEDHSGEVLNDFLTFLRKLSRTEGKTMQTILSAWVYIIVHEPGLASQGQDVIMSQISKRTKLPEVLVKPMYLKTIQRYLSSDLPY